MNATTDLTTAMVTMIAALAVVVGIILLLFYAVRRFSIISGGPRHQRLVTVLGNTHLGVKKHVSLVEIPGAVLVLGVTADRISLLATIDDPATVEAIRRQPEAGPRPSFLRQLQQAAGKK
ncbi:MAG: flagellar biosynthetic protein FliO [Pseudomonadota bacterium]